MSDIPNTQQVPLGVVLTITTGRMLCEMEHLHRALEFLAAVPLFTHQLPRAGRAAAAHLLHVHPVLQRVDLDGLDRMLADSTDRKYTCLTWVSQEQVRLSVECLVLSPLPEGLYTPADPQDELIEMMTRGDR